MEKCFLSMRFLNSFVASHFIFHFSETSQHNRGLTFLQTNTAVDVYGEQAYRITGLAILGNELFIACYSSVIEVNDLRTLKFKRRWREEQANTIIDMKSSVRVNIVKCLYILCRCRLNHWNTAASILRFCDKGKLVTQWDFEVIQQYKSYNAQISVPD